MCSEKEYKAAGSGSVVGEGSDSEGGADSDWEEAEAMATEEVVEMVKAEGGADLVL